MKNYSGCSPRLLLVSLIFALGLAGATQAQDDWAAPTPIPATPLPLNETVTGSLDGPGARNTYTFELPVDQDIVVAYEADKMVTDYYCITLSTASSQEVLCDPTGGSAGSDHPVSRAFVIPANGQPDVRRTVALDLIRPDLLESPANYTLTSYAVTPQMVEPGELVAVEPDPAQPYQAFILDVDLQQPFTVQLDDDGNSLGLSHEPYRWGPWGGIRFSDEKQLFPAFIDGTGREENPDGISRTQLIYFGGTTFRVWVEATGDYTLQFTPAPVIFLPQNETVTGSLDGPGARNTYTFELPVDQDIVIAYEANNMVIDDYCIIPTAPSSQRVRCSPVVGRTGEGSMSRAFVIPASGQADAHRAALSLSHPGSTGGPLNYTLTAYAMAPQVVRPGYPVDFDFDPSQPYQVYALDMYLGQPFSVQIEDAAANGDYLWVAHQPYNPNQMAMIWTAEEGQLVPFYIDSAQREDNPGGINGIQLDYFGGTTFRALVNTAGDYTLLFMPVVAQSLPENSERLLTATYQMPLQLVTLDTDVSDLVEVTFRMVDGPGALTHIYGRVNWEGLHSALGQAGVTETPFPLSDTVSWRSTGGERVAVVQIPQEFTRGEVTVAVTWRRVPEAQN